MHHNVLQQLASSLKSVQSTIPSHTLDARRHWLLTPPVLQRKFGGMQTANNKQAICQYSSAHWKNRITTTRSHCPIHRIKQINSSPLIKRDCFRIDGKLNESYGVWGPFACLWQRISAELGLYCLCGESDKGVDWDISNWFRHKTRQKNEISRAIRKSRIVLQDFSCFMLLNQHIKICFRVSLSWTHVVNNKFTDDENIKREIRDLFQRTNLLSRRFSKCSITVKFFFLNHIVYVYMMPPCGTLLLWAPWTNWNRATFSWLKSMLQRYDYVIRIESTVIQRVVKWLSLIVFSAMEHLY
jgi:hypothetical protein